ncbi:triple tyrosine motif-containing protein, partial [Clostridium paraputrificum]|uniref:triple tyrosine motif-containing protein n=1 Tax=Clostridium paraputrificum TaxID=29363 RepID=UPI00232D745C
ENVSINSITTDKPSPQLTNSPIKIFANAVGNGDLQYKFSLFDGQSWILLQDFSSKNYYSWTPRKSGTYRIYIDVKDSSGKSDAKDLYYTINENVSINSITTDKPSPQLTNSPIKIFANAVGNGDLQYKFSSSI